MKAFLTSDFSPSVMTTMDPYMGDISGKKVLFVITAAIGEGFVPYYDENDKPFIKRGALVERYDIAGKEKAEIAAKLKEIDIVYVGGGNTFYLLQHLKACDFKSVLSQDWAREKIYIGSSAGSIVTGPDIEFIKEMDDPTRATLDDHKGFGWIDFLFLPHFEVPTMPALAKAAYKIVTTYNGEIPMMVFEDHQVVYVPDVQKHLTFIL